MLKTLSAAILITILSILNTVNAQDYLNELKLMPYPQKLEAAPGRLVLDENFSVVVKGAYTIRVKNYTLRFLNRLAGRTGIFFRNNEVSENSSIEDVKLVINTGREGKLVDNEDESYELNVNDREIVITSVTDIGSMRALETLLQLLLADQGNYFFPSVKIKDAPRFTWRGLMFDAGRHFMPVDVLKRNLDGMAAVKMNIMHWHLTEDQGFRIECHTFPELHKLGSEGQYYTQEQIKEIIAYANARGIRVVPEFDIPGHSTSWFISHPEFASADGPYTLERKWGIFNPTFDPTKEEVYVFLDKFFAEMSSLFNDEYMHIGGDENNGKQWSANTRIKKFMADNNIADNHALQGYFNKRILKIVTKYNKKMMGWANILRDDMPKNILMQSWQGVESLAKSAKLGYKSILSSDYYIDLVQPTTVHYLNDPIPENSTLTEQERKLILGGEATMWSEFVNSETVDSRVWPRTAAIAERLWSPQSVRDIYDMYKRMEYISFRLEELGLMHEKNTTVMLRRLTNNADIAALKNLVDLVEP
ncbi:MAG: beta-N-acetylhexosaminidase, partial [Methanococcaceae archaeon]